MCRPPIRAARVMWTNTTVAAAIAAPLRATGPRPPASIRWRRPIRRAMPRATAMPIPAATPMPPTTSRLTGCVSSTATILSGMTPGCGRPIGTIPGTTAAGATPGAGVGATTVPGTTVRAGTAVTATAGDVLTIPGAVLITTADATTTGAVRARVVRSTTGALIPAIATPMWSRAATQVTATVTITAV